VVGKALDTRDRVQWRIDLELGSPPAPNYEHLAAAFLMHCIVELWSDINRRWKLSPIGIRLEAANVRAVNQELTSSEIQEPPSVGLRAVLCIALTT